MTLTTIILWIFGISLVSYAIFQYLLKVRQTLLMSFLQHFCGVWFILSGFVKAVDPMGTAYKMEEYFAAFYTTLAGTKMSFLANIFPWMGERALTVSITMIVLELVIGIMLIFGISRKFTAWTFFLIMLFFTILTGFTFLTGYVPQEANFFQFSKWGPFVEGNMRVTDCGCFGDFIKLLPKISFQKDLFLMIPAIFFILKWRDMHQAFSLSIRGIIGWSSVALSSLFCMYNFMWNEPVINFRPFKVGTNIREQKAAEEEAMGSVKITDWKLKEVATGKTLVISNDEYLKNLSKYPGEQFEVVDQIKTEPTIAKTKISDFGVSKLDNEEFTESLLSGPELKMLIIAPHLLGKEREEIYSSVDSIFVMDTIKIGDSMALQKSFKELQKVQKKRTVIDWDPEYLAKYSSFVELSKLGKEKGVSSYLITAYRDVDHIKSFVQKSGLKAEALTADDKLVKTMLRSDPGLMILQDGKILGFYHRTKLPKLEDILNLGSKGDK
jgi:uncharacterized membrane protein YphA (DoxX/SURF4 family)